MLLGQIGNKPIIQKLWTSTLIELPLPNFQELRRLRLEGCPYKGCKLYTIACRVNYDGTLGEIIESWPGYSFECPDLWWDGVTPWYWFTTSFLTTTGTSQTWNVPADWNSSSNTIEAVGSGGDGVSTGLGSGGPTGGGGGGGAYSVITNFSTTPSSTESFQIGAAGSTTTTSLKDSSTLVADYGRKGTTYVGGAGGLASNSVGGTKYDGGSGGNGSQFSNGSGGGGGGAAGPSGAGKSGGSSNFNRGGGAGGGGSNGWSSSAGGAANANNGANGGNGSGGSGGGTGSTANNTAGGDGSNGGGGGGSYSDLGGGTSGRGGHGGSDQAWDATHGCGGGGGCPGGRNSVMGGVGNGAIYGGAGSGASTAGYVNSAGVGAQGIIVITYTPAGGFLKLIGIGGGALGDMGGLIA